MVIGYSKTISFYSKLDAYPTDNIEKLLPKVRRNSWFSKINPKAACNQILLIEKECKLTGFEACGGLYEFTKLPFGVSNAVAIFQIIMDQFIAKYNLEG